jgi:hypothetical protein
VVSIDSWWNGNVRDRSADVLELVLTAISDDYSNVGMILESINEWDSNYGPATWPARKAIPVNHREVVHALADLTREGYAQAYVLDTGEAQPARFSEEGIRDLWFCATPKGMGAIQQLYERVSDPSSKDN